MIVFPLVMPESKIVFVTDLWATILKLYFLIVIPLDIGFDYRILYTSGYIVTFLFGIMLMSEFVLKLFTVYYEYG